MVRGGFALGLDQTGRSTKSCPSQASKGLRNSSRSEFGSIRNRHPLALPGGGQESSVTSARPFSGRAGGFGGLSMNCTPSVPVRVSLCGSKPAKPAMAIAAATAGEVRNARVSGFASFLPLKLRLKVVNRQLDSPFLTSCLSHWPIQGPQEAERITAPADNNLSRMPSRLRVSKICVDPGENNRASWA